MLPFSTYAIVNVRGTSRYPVQHIVRGSSPNPFFSNGRGNESTHTESLIPVSVQKRIFTPRRGGGFGIATTRQPRRGVKKVESPNGGRGKGPTAHHADRPSAIGTYASDARSPPGPYYGGSVSARMSSSVRDHVPPIAGSPTTALQKNRSRCNID